MCWGGKKERKNWRVEEGERMRKKSREGENKRLLEKEKISHIVGLNEGRSDGEGRSFLEELSNVDKLSPAQRNFHMC